MFADVRVRRPQQHERLMLELQQDAKFPAFRDILLFAAAVGFAQGRRAPFHDTAGDPIRYDTLVGPAFADTLVSMIAANEAGDDPEIMDDTRLQERVKIFEEYANGGLEYIQELINTRKQPTATVVLDLVTSALTDENQNTEIAVEDLLSGVTW
ncbi:DNA phosphorothioation-associated protein 4 [Rhodococcus sp. Z13]|uniref:DNA phosphorothioation-associated protein 4 n=1 Tax=Rhodococcus sacchari TaxID=2962047 RepID=A0ACD4DMI0_9NOCA|nr:DNA phosphorothioation-associated protein 4 [Rhodococcus sp. Z13]